MARPTYHGQRPTMDWTRIEADAQKRALFASVAVMLSEADALADEALDIRRRLGGIDSELSAAFYGLRDAVAGLQRALERRDAYLREAELLRQRSAEEES